MTEPGSKDKGSTRFRFGNRKTSDIVPVESYDDERVGHKNDEEGGSLAPWPERTGGISDSALKSIETKRPVEENDDLDDWPNED